MHNNEPRADDAYDAYLKKSDLRNAIISELENAVKFHQMYDLARGMPEAAEVVREACNNHLNRAAAYGKQLKEIV